MIKKLPGGQYFSSNFSANRISPTRSDRRASISCSHEAPIVTRSQRSRTASNRLDVLLSSCLIASRVPEVNPSFRPISRHLALTSTNSSHTVSKSFVSKPRVVPVHKDSATQIYNNVLLDLAFNIWQSVQQAANMMQTNDQNNYA